MQVTLNGKAETIDDGLTVADLLRNRQAEPRRVAVEMNRELVVRADYETATISEGDQIEIVSFVGGG